MSRNDNRVFMMVPIAVSQNRSELVRKLTALIANEKCHSVIVIRLTEKIQQPLKNYTSLPQKLAYMSVDKINEIFILKLYTPAKSRTIKLNRIQILKPPSEKAPSAKSIT